MRTMIVTLVLAAALPALAQSPAPAPASPQKSLASTLEVYVFPTTGQDASQQSQQVTAEQIENFKKAFSVCLEAKEYMVKF